MQEVKLHNTNNTVYITDTDSPLSQDINLGTIKDSKFIPNKHTMSRGYSIGELLSIIKLIALEEKT